MTPSPRLDPSRKPFRLAVYLRPDDQRRLQAVAERDGLSVSHWVRKLIIDQLGRRGA